MCGEVRYLACEKIEGDGWSSNVDFSSSSSACFSEIRRWFSASEVEREVSSTFPAAKSESISASTSREGGGTSGINRYRIGPAFMISVTEASFAKVAMKAFGTGEMTLCCFELGSLFKLARMQEDSAYLQKSKHSHLPEPLQNSQDFALFIEVSGRGEELQMDCSGSEGAGFGGEGGRHGF